MKTHNLHRPTLIGHSMGAKTVMCVALHSPSKIANLIAVDNAPVDAALRSDFGTYVKGMREVERANISKQSEADEILQPYAKVYDEWFAPSVRPTPHSFLSKTNRTDALSYLRNSPSANSSSPTFHVQRVKTARLSSTGACH